MKNRKKSNRPVRADYEQAMQSMDSYIDITLDDIMELSKRAEYFASQRLTESLGVSGIMGQPVISVRPNSRMSEAAHLMVTRRISGLPVIDEANRLAGIITEADFLRALGMPVHQPHHNLWQTLESMFKNFSQHTELESPDDLVSEHMTRDVICAPPDKDVHDIVDLMKRHQVKRVLICNEDDHVVGVVTRSDLVRIFFDRFVSIKK
ncbi:MAG: CBS domain-containing protein [Proteobacteria bacterium]|jgi:CBS-domain-containing membrane protein|nr:CBS domain-containing protein [Pseudomonadota bacterium]